MIGSGRVRRKVVVFKLKEKVSQRQMIHLEKQLSRIKNNDMMIIPENIDIQILDLDTEELSKPWGFYDPVEYAEDLVKQEKTDILEEIGKDPILERDRLESLVGATGTLAVPMGSVVTMAGTSYFTTGS